MRKPLLLLLVTVSTATSASTSLLIENFPGMSDFQKKQYHGYLNVTNNNVIHYWFIESENDSENDPLVLWLSGGPGCSSLFALFTEIGPYMVTTDGQNLIRNPYSWNKIANLLFFESPVGVGYSLVKNEVISNDDTACTDHYAALLEFFKLYPQYKLNDFYVTGESYAGVYIPMLAKKILEQRRQHPIKLKGLMIGNGLLDFDLRINTFVLFAYHHGFIDESAWQRAKTECCLGDIDACDFTRFSTGFCKYFFDKTHHDARYALLLHRYNMYADCSQNNSRQFKHYSSWPMQNDTEKLTCAGVAATATLMNRDDVRNALLIPRNAPQWKSCGDTIKYRKIYRSMQDLLKCIINSGIKVLLHYGDLDLVCNFIHGEKFAQKLGFHVTEPKEPFVVNGRHAGFITKYDNLEVAIVHGAGHMVPTDKPDVALYLLEDFIKGSSPIFSQTTKIPPSPSITPRFLISSVIMQHSQQNDSNVTSPISLAQKCSSIQATSDYGKNSSYYELSSSVDPLYDRIAVAIMLLVAEVLVILLKRF